MRRRAMAPKITAALMPALAALSRCVRLQHCIFQGCVQQQRFRKQFAIGVRGKVNVFDTFFPAPKRYIALSKDSYSVSPGAPPYALPSLFDAAFRQRFATVTGTRRIRHLHLRWWQNIRVICGNKRRLTRPFRRLKCEVPHLQYAQE